MQTRIRFLALALTVLAACAASRAQVIARTQAGVDAAFHAFQAADLQRQLDIKATMTEAEGAPVLAQHRAARDKINKAFVAAYGAIAAAALSPSDLTFARMASLSLQAYDALKGWLR